MDMVASVAIMIIFNLFAKAEEVKNRCNDGLGLLDLGPAVLILSGETFHMS